MVFEAAKEVLERKKEMVRKEDKEEVKVKTIDSSSYALIQQMETNKKVMA